MKIPMKLLVHSGRNNPISPLRSGLKKKRKKKEKKKKWPPDSTVSFPVWAMETLDLALPLTEVSESRRPWIPVMRWLIIRRN